MYRFLGTCVMRGWWAILLVWAVALVSLMLVKPNWDDVVEQGEFAFLPSKMPSIKAEKLYEEVWGEPQASRVVIVARRENVKLTADDRDFVADVLRPKLEALLEELGIPQPKAKPGAVTTDKEPESVGKYIKTFRSVSYDKVLDSTNGTATMVLINLKTEFFDESNTNLINRIEALISPDHPDSLYKAKPGVPPGLHLALSGDATVGRDMMRAAKESSKATELWTVLLVVVLLLVIYRAPILAVIPLLTVGVATEVSLAILAILAKLSLLDVLPFKLGLFNGIEVYVKILCYGAGVDYCLFLIARFKEELDDGQAQHEAVGSSISKVGHALVASAGTVICGIGMMMFADFGKFRQAGAAITLGLVVVLIASMTFTPAMLRLAGQWAFWPHIPTSKLRASGGWVSATGLMASVFRRNVFELMWQKIGDLIVRRPMFVLSASVTAMLPFAIAGCFLRQHLSYGLLTELPQNNASVLGANAIKDHYAAGIAGPVTILLRSPSVSMTDGKGEASQQPAAVDFTSEAGEDSIDKLTESLFEKRVDLKLAEIRSLKHPFGVIQARRDAENPPEEAPLSFGDRIKLIAEKKVLEAEIRKVYVGQVGPQAAHVTRLDLVFQEDPFSRGTMSRFDNLVETIRSQAQKLVSQNIEVHVIGPTASLTDLKTTTDRDAIVVDALVLAGVFLILLVLLRQFVVSVYLIVSVFFSYLVTLGVTFAFFWMLDPSGFSGLDWKVPTFLFTILIAVGEDYNIFLMTRIQEEQTTHGPIKGVTVALTRTGSIISSCGIIMAGTFSSLLAGTLVGMHQLGFALAFGVLLDTFVVRPILVPAFLVLLYDGRFRSMSALMGTDRATEVPVEEHSEIMPRTDA